MGEIDSNSANGIKIENDDDVSKGLALQEKGKRSDDQGGVGSQRRVCLCTRDADVPMVHRGIQTGRGACSYSRERCLLMVRLSPGRRQKSWSPVNRDRKDPGKAQTQMCEAGVGEDEVC